MSDRARRDDPRRALIFPPCVPRSRITGTGHSSLADRGPGGAMVDVSPERISQNSGFQALVAVALELFAAEARVVKEMNPDQRNAYAARANALGTEARNAPASQKEQATADLGDLLGLSEAVTDALMLRAHTAAKEFSSAFPELAGMDERKKLDTLAEAVKRDPA